MKQRPLPITVLAVFALIGGILSLVAGMALMFGGGLGSAYDAAQGGAVMALGAAMFAVGVVSFLLGYGFWIVRPWARPVGLVVYGVGIGVNVVSVVFFTADPLSVVLPLVIAIGIIAYLLMPATRTTFRRPEASTTATA